MNTANGTFYRSKCICSYNLLCVAFLFVYLRCKIYTFRHTPTNETAWAQHNSFPTLRYIFFLFVYLVKCSINYKLSGNYFDWYVFTWFATTQSKRIWWCEMPTNYNSFESKWSSSINTFECEFDFFGEVRKKITFATCLFGGLFNHSAEMNLDIWCVWPDEINRIQYQCEKIRWNEVQ